MSYLFDASAIINLVKKRCARLLALGYTIELALYELTNAIWKECALVGALTQDEAIRLLRNCVKAAKAIPKIDVDEVQVFELALTNKMTAYDASYLYASRKGKLVLVTDDKTLKSASNGITSEEFRKKHAYL